MTTLSSRLLAGFGTFALLAAIGLFASRPAHTAGGPVPVFVANTVQNRDVDNSTRQPFQVESLIGFNGTSTHQVLTQVPAGKRLVIESLTAEYNNSPVNSYSVILEGDSVSGNVGLSLTPSTDPYPTKTQPVRLTAEAGENVNLYVNSNAVQNAATVIVSASGYYVNVP